MITKIIAYQIHTFDDPVLEDDAYTCARECSGQEEFDHFVFKEDSKGVSTCEEIENLLKEFHEKILMAPAEMHTLRNIIIKHLFSGQYA